MAESKEIREKKKKQREVALLNLKGNIAALASTYSIENSKDFGEAVGSAVDQFIYQPALTGTKFTDPESLQEGNLLSQGLLSTRKDGKRYTGSIDEHYILTTASGIAQSSLGYITVEDVFNLMGSKSPISDKLKRKIAGFVGKSTEDAYKELYVSQMPEEFQKAIMGSYFTHLSYAKASSALGIAASKIPAGLEKLLTEEPKGKSA